VDKAPIRRRTIPRSRAIIPYGEHDVKPASLPGSLATLIRKLIHQKRVRDREEAFVLEGAKPILDLLVSHASAFRAVVMATQEVERRDEISQAAAHARVPVYACPARIFATLSDVATPSGMLAVLRQPTWDENALLERVRLLAFYGEALQDPNNVGSCIRTALAFGLDAMWLSPDSVDVFNPKVVRGTAGGVLNMPVLLLKEVATFVEAGCGLLAAEAPHGTSHSIRDIHSIPMKAIIALGNESRGLSEKTLGRALVRFHIPIDPRIESLNVAASAAIAAFYYQLLPRSQ
jgi:RNA methyltransferase, TrmH family